ncbi:hypothetical protein [Kalamiella sp. sgz302252]|uniref:hypothetical protein n=1 Tax=Pantoea sp. sgz302252 TaxID=3341827 RepID=UPI0036D32472
MVNIGNTATYPIGFNTSAAGASSTIHSPANENNVNAAKEKKCSFGKRLKEVVTSPIEFIKNRPEILIAGGIVTALVGVGTGFAPIIGIGIGMAIGGYIINRQNNAANARQGRVISQAPATMQNNNTRNQIPN